MVFYISNNPSKKSVFCIHIQLHHIDSKDLNLPAIHRREHLANEKAPSIFTKRKNANCIGDCIAAKASQYKLLFIKEASCNLATTAARRNMQLDLFVSCLVQ